MLIVTSISFLSLKPEAEAQYGPRTYTPPSQGAFYSLQFGGTNFVPLPYLPFDPVTEMAVYPVLGMTNSFVYDDQDMTYGFQVTPAVPDPPGSGGDGGTPPGPFYWSYKTNDLYLEPFPLVNAAIPLLLHGTKSNCYYQLDQAPAITTQPAVQPKWKPGEVIRDTIGTNGLWFEPVPTENRAEKFFRAAEGHALVSISRMSDAIEPHGPAHQKQVGQFQVALDPYFDLLPTNLTVYYQITGYVNSASAENGVDYANLSGSVIIPSNSFSATIDIDPVEDNLIEFCEFVTLTLIRTNHYLVDPTQASATATISDYFETNVFTVVAENLTGPAGIGYHPVTNALIVSVKSYTNSTINFIRIDTNGIISPWSVAHDIDDEKKLTIVPSTANGFNQGDIYFGTDVNGVIGWISADATTWTNSWAVLTTNQLGADALLRGSLHVDRSGSFGGDIIAVTGGDSGSDGGQVWRMDSSRNATLLINITNTHLEGVVTITNYAQQWGPLAGSLVTGAEGETPPIIFTVKPDGTSTALELGIEPEDFDIIPPNQNLYCVDQGNHPLAGAAPRIIKLPSSLLTNYWGALLITQEGAQRLPSTKNPKLFIVQWDPTRSSFIVRCIDYSFLLEHATFAPIDIPEVP